MQKIEQYDYIMNRDELSLLDGIVELLDVFNVFTTFIQGNSYPTLNTFVLFYAEIQDHLKKMRDICDDGDSSADSVIGKAADILLKNLDKRLPLNEECIGAALIDPRMQRLPIIDKWLTEHGK